MFGRLATSSELMRSSYVATWMSGEEGHGKFGYPPRVRSIQRISFGAAIAAVVFLTACEAKQTEANGEVGKLGQLIAAVEGGEQCSELMTQLKAMDEKSDVYSTAQDKLRSVGCYSFDSVRSDLGANGDSRRGVEPWPGVPGQKVTPSDACVKAAKRAAREVDPERADPLIAATLDACTSVNEWMSVLEAFPGVMIGSAPDLISLQVACYGNKQTAVCQDAIKAGILEK